MILAVDIGNSNIVIGGFTDSRGRGSQNEILFVERLSTNHGATVTEYTITIKNLLELNNLSGTEFEGGIVSSVVPPLTNTLKTAMERVGCGKVLTVAPGLKTGLKILLDNPAQLGSDRVADAVAAINLYKPPIILIDMGTATTISVIDRNLNFLGGMIIPGLRVSLDSLTSRTSQLPKISLTPPKRLIGTNTIDCMKSGILTSTACSIDGIIDRIEEELQEPCTAVSTGGLSGVIIPYCKHKIVLDDMLLLKGLKIIYEKNC